MALCGPKLSVCGMIIGLWGVVMLAFLGLFFRIHSPALIEDLPLDEAKWQEQDFGDDYVYGLYNQASLNCWIAAGLYVLVFGFSFIQHRINLRANYVMS